MRRRQPFSARKPRGIFQSAPDGWEHRLRVALRLGNGAVLTARQCHDLAVALGWTTGERP